MSIPSAAARGGRHREDPHLRILSIAAPGKIKLGYQLGRNRSQGRRRPIVLGMYGGTGHEYCNAAGPALARLPRRHRGIRRL